MFYMVIAAEVKNGLRNINDVPAEIRQTVKTAISDYDKKAKKAK